MPFVTISYVITFDADGQHKISDALAMLDYIQKNPSFDIVIGSRFLKSDRPLKIPLKKILLLKLATKFTSWSTGLNLTDTHNGLRVFPLKTAAKLKITQNGMAHASEILELIAKENLNFKEHHTEILYTEYSIAKGQKISNSLNILWELFTKRMKQ